VIRFLQKTLASNRSFRGGLFLPTIGRAVDRSPLLPCPPPATLSVPLSSAGGSESVALVAPGEPVQAGQLIARAEKPGALNVHAPVTGHISKWVRVDTGRCTDVLAVLIETAADAQITSPAGVVTPKSADIPETWEPSDLQQIIAAAHDAGLTDFQPRSCGLGAQLEKAVGKPVRHLIINTLPGEPLASQSHLDVQPNLLVRVAGWLGGALSAEHIWIAADRSDTRTVRRLRAAVRSTRIRVAGLVNKYPQHAPILLASGIAGVETPPGGHTLDVGVLVVQAEALANLAAALAWPGHEPVPMTHRVVTVAGPVVNRPGRYWIPIGTPFAHVLGHVGLHDTPKRVIEGGPLTGRAVAHLDVVTTKETSGLLVLEKSADRVPSPGPCVRCGWCQEDCPVGLDPQMLLNLAEQHDAARAAAFFPEACLECGVCSYVCPAELPLATAAAQLRQLISRENQSREAKLDH
jgi:electron transport complex protein RnfC